MTTTRTKRTDIHRPSAIHPEDYHFVEVKHIGCRELDPFEAVANAQAISRIRDHMKRTGGHYSQHEHGGTCHVCGAFALYLAVYYHPHTNTYIEVGEDCCRKMELDGDQLAFRTLRRAIQNAREAKAGKMKAKLLLEDRGLSRVWELHTLDRDVMLRDGLLWEDRYGTQHAIEPLRILQDIVHKLVKYGSLSDKQFAFLAKLPDRIDRHKEIEAQRKAEHDAAEDCPSGKVVIQGTVLKTDWRETPYGDVLKMLVKSPTGYLVWGTVPSAISDVEKGAEVEFSATVTQSDDDPKFGFYKRPTKAKVLSAVAS